MFVSLFCSNKVRFAVLYRGCFVSFLLHFLFFFFFFFFLRVGAVVDSRLRCCWHGATKYCPPFFFFFVLHLYLWTRRCNPPEDMIKPTKNIKFIAQIIDPRVNAIHNIPILRSHGTRRRGRQRKRWEDNIKEWTGLQWNIALQKAENREEWRKLVVKSTVVPQRSARLRDR